MCLCVCVSAPADFYALCVIQKPQVKFEGSALYAIKADNGQNLLLIISHCWPWIADICDGCRVLGGQCYSGSYLIIYSLWSGRYFHTGDSSSLMSFEVKSAVILLKIISDWEHNGTVFIASIKQAMKTTTTKPVRTTRMKRTILMSESRFYNYLFSCLHPFISH